MSDKKKTPEMLAAELAAFARSVTYAMSMFRDETYESGAALCKAFGAHVGNEAVKRLRALGEYPRRRQTYRQYKRCGCAQAEYNAVNRLYR